MKISEFTICASLIIITVNIFSCNKTPVTTNGGKPNSDTTAPTKDSIIYTNVNPDSIIISPTMNLYNLDLNNDGVKDFVFTETDEPATCRSKKGIKYIGGVRPARGSNNATLFDGMGVSRPLDSLAIIDSIALYWSTDTISGNLFVIADTIARKCNPIYSGPWAFTNYNYLGLKFVKDNYTYYGWARLSTSGLPSLILLDYAYNAIPNKPILAGQKH